MGSHLSAAELSEETAAPPTQLEWLERVGILRPTEPGRYVPGDVFRVRMITALLDAGFTPDEVQWAASEGALDLQHIDAYPLMDSLETSSRSIEEFTDGVGASAETIPEIYRALRLPEPAPGSSLLVTEESLLARFLQVWRLAGDDAAPAPLSRYSGPADLEVGAAGFEHATSSCEANSAP